jgi:hypothetical protein
VPNALEKLLKGWPPPERQAAAEILARCVRTLEQLTGDAENLAVVAERKHWEHHAAADLSAALRWLFAALSAGDLEELAHSAAHARHYVSARTGQPPLFGTRPDAIRRLLAGVGWQLARGTEADRDQPSALAIRVVSALVENVREYPELKPLQDELPADYVGRQSDAITRVDRLLLTDWPGSGAPPEEHTAFAKKLLLCALRALGYEGSSDDLFGFLRKERRGGGAV